MSLPRMMHADVQFQIYRLEQMAMGGALAFDADELRNACHLIRTLATELDATAAPVVVGEVTDAMVEAFCRSYWHGDWPYIKTEADREICNSLRKSVRKALTAALAGEE